MMRKTMILTAVLSAMIGATAIAQTGQVSVSGAYLKGTSDNNKADLWGGGISGKVFLGNRFGLGASLHTFPKSSSAIEVDGFKYTTSDVVNNIAANFDFLLANKSQTIQPYIGVDAGVSFNSQTITYTNNSDQYIENKNKDNFFLLSPKAGVNIGLGQAFGIFGQAQYNFTFGDGKSTNISEVPNPFKTEPVSKYFTFDAGIYFRFMPAK